MTESGRSIFKLVAIAKLYCRNWPLHPLVCACLVPGVHRLRRPFFDISFRRDDSTHAGGYISKSASPGFGLLAFSERSKKSKSLSGNDLLEVSFARCFSRKSAGCGRKHARLLDRINGAPRRCAGVQNPLQRWGGQNGELDSSCRLKPSDQSQRLGRRRCDGS